MRMHSTVCTHTAFQLFIYFLKKYVYHELLETLTTSLALFAYFFFCQDFLQTVLDVLTPDDVRVLAESENELSCRGQFERIFPSPWSSRYLRFFEGPRYLNTLLDQWEQKHWNDRLKGFFFSFFFFLMEFRNLTLKV